ncbi:class I SAM-dependent methyltransferase [Streptomyces sp. NPDC020875]|uniref:class I SAM-dependent methyltransferase n=1 Tax=Streptomyces sp. NPDC020875 TaxID=3154898 RepID=UPI0033EC4EC6
MVKCRVCGESVVEFVDFGRQPLSDAFRVPGDTRPEFFFRLAVGVCESCAMVQLMEEVPRDRMFHEEYPYRSSGSARMREHFTATALRLLERECRRDDPFVVEIGCNDGVMLRTVKEKGVRHLGVDPSGGVAETARELGVDVLTAFFEEETARRVRAEHGPADVIFSANTICHIPYLDSVLRGVDALLAPGGVFLFEDPYLGDILAKNSFDQIYDEHFYFFSAHSVRAAAERFGFELVDVERLPVHGGEVRYSLARRGERVATPAVAALLAEEEREEILSLARLRLFAERVHQVRADLIGTLRGLREEGKRVVAYGATAKSATVTNYCGITPELVSFVCDTTPEKQGRLSPGAHLPVRPGEAFSEPYPDYALLFAWNHAEEIMAKETGFREAGGRWITYVPEVTIV